MYPDPQNSVSQTTERPRHVQLHSVQYCTECNYALSLVGVNDQEEPSLRETKRRATRAAIEENATGLVAERGIENVTVEDICAAVGISKRTFFNYVDSKETAILGDPPRPPGEEERAVFVAQRHDNLLHAIVELTIEASLSGQLIDSERRTEILKQRKEIRHRHPELILQRSASFHELHHVLRDMLVDYFTAHQDAQVTESSPTREASTIVTLAGNTVQLGYMAWLHGDDNSPAALDAACQQALSDITTLIETHNGPVVHERSSL